jgi:hypothetical protein
MRSWRARPRAQTLFAMWWQEFAVEVAPGRDSFLGALASGSRGRCRAAAGPGTLHGRPAPSAGNGSLCRDRSLLIYDPAKSRTNGLMSA